MKGMNKITRGPKPLRFLWLTFVTTMTTVLIVASCLLVGDFMLYDVNINTEVRLDSDTPFPSLTICHHHPFSKKAYRLWRNNEILSPSLFNKKMRDLAHNVLLTNDIEEASKVINYDGISVYYQNLEYGDSLRVGHEKGIYLSCMHLRGNDISFEDDCSKLEEYEVKKYSHHEHFNCYTFQAKSPDISTLGVIVSMGPAPDYSNTEQAFIVDTFRQSQGLKVIVHEPDIPPDIDNAGLHVEPGKLNEISYRPVEWQLVNTNKKPCYDDDKGEVYKDLDSVYNYTQDLCLRSAEQKRIIDECKCMYIYNPRLQIPTKEIPYCGNLIANFDLKKFNNRIHCLQIIKQDITFKKNLQSEKCFQRCKYMKYETSISITKWRATEWHLHWIRLLVSIFRELKSFSPENMTSSTPYKSWLKYWKATNLTIINEDKRERFLANENFAYIVLRRESPNSVRKYERLVITPYVLVSRIGGLCSLTVGITASFFVEILEFLYLYYKSNKESKSMKPKETVYKDNSSHLKHHALKKSSMKKSQNKNKPNLLKCEFKDFSEPTRDIVKKLELSNNSSDQIREILL